MESKDNNDRYLEPRVAKLEAGLEILTRDVSSLASIVREQGKNIESQIQQLAVGLTAAQAPRKTDWSTIISAVMLILAVGSAVFWPLNQATQYNKEEIKGIQSALVEHKSLEGHPVGAAKIDAMEKRFEYHSEADSRALDALDKKLQKETELITSELKSRVNEISLKYDREIQNLGDRLLARINTYDNHLLEERRLNEDELRQWRNRALLGNNKTN